mmetsp:Transcript_31450/g.83788  ORF Transcript_31450/g.83788 Transcript_31450/m.83788 type:complete len:308 (-) Transcript_31450:436-1359(-)
MVEMQLRAELLSLKRSQSSLTRRVSQLTGLVSELQPLWLTAPDDVQDQVQLALAAKTPRMGLCATLLNPIREPISEAGDTPHTEVHGVGRGKDDGVSEASSGASDCTGADSPSQSSRTSSNSAEAQSTQGPSQRLSVPPLATLPALGKLRGRGPPLPKTIPLGLAMGVTKAQNDPSASLSRRSGSSVSLKATDLERSTPPSTARHRMDEGDAADEAARALGEVSEEPALGEVTASREHYHAVLASLEAELAAKISLQEEVAALRSGRNAQHATDKLERQLLKESAARNSLLQSVDLVNAEWAWHGLS